MNPHSSILSQIASAYRDVASSAVKELLKSFRIESIGSFRHDGELVYAHIASGVGYKLKLSWDESSVRWHAEPGQYFPQPEPIKDEFGISEDV